MKPMKDCIRIIVTFLCLYAAKSEAKEFVVGTEYGIIHRLKKENPEKIFYPLQPLPACGDMKKIRPEDVLRCLECGFGEVTLPADIMKKARLPVDRMLAL